MRRGFFDGAPRGSGATPGRPPAAAAAAAQAQAAPAAAARVAPVAGTDGAGAEEDATALQGTQAAEPRLRGAPAAALFPPRLRRFQYVPPVDGVAENLLILLHGRGDRAAPFAAFARKMALPQTAALALEGTLEVPFSDGGRAWFDAFEADMTLIAPAPGETRRVRSLAASVDALCAALDALVTRGGYRHAQLHLFGFSDGGTVALETALRYSGARRLGGVATVSAALLPESLSDASTTQLPPLPPPHTPVLLTHGERDDALPAAAVAATAAALLRRAPGCGAHFHAVRGKGHAMPRDADEMRALMTFWAHTLRAAPPPAAPGERIVEVA